MILKKIEINSLNTKEKVNQLISILNDDFRYELQFKYIKHIPYSLVIKLQSIKNKLKIIVDDRKLKYYLLNLDFNVVHVEYKKIDPYHILDSIKYVAIGGSAGSLAKIIDIVKFLPKTELSFFVIMHHKSGEPNHLAEILSKYTIYYDVVEVTEDIKIKPATIYIAPSSYHIVVNDTYVSIDDSANKHFSKPSISIAFDSMAKQFKEKLLAIVLCGYGEDGSDSLKIVKDNGGAVIIEQLFECQAIAMLEAAIKTKQFDKLLSVNDISKLFYDKFYKTFSIEQNLDIFLEDIKNTYNYDYKGYNKKHIIRRIEHYYTILESKNFASFKYKILNNKKLFQDLFLDISINITTMFRNPEVYTQLKVELKELFTKHKSVKIWCAGCSSGEEPYSMAILLNELGYLNRSIIYATDINNVILEYAKNGLYSDVSYEEFKINYENATSNNNFDQYFDFYDNFVGIKKELKENILFFKHNLVQSQKIDEFQLIICRNVIIYFNKDLTIKVFDLFDESLTPNGLLLLGESETFYNKYDYSIISKSNKIFLKQDKI